MSSLQASLLLDVYKLSHRRCYPKGTIMIYSVWVPRDSRLPNITRLVNFCPQMFVRKLKEIWDETFFKKSKRAVMKEYRRIVSGILGISTKKVETEHLE